MYSYQHTFCLIYKRRAGHKKSARHNLLYLPPSISTGIILNNECARTSKRFDLFFLRSLAINKIISVRTSGTCVVLWN